MHIGGFHKVSLIDYPKKIAAVLFTLGCNFRCPYCHNPELVNPKRETQEIPWTTIYEFLKKRQRLLDGVVISGGEPTLQPDIVETIKQIRDLGFSVKLDTNGSCPETLKNLIEKRLIDYIAMDIKGPLEHYQKFTAVAVDVVKIKESIALIMNSGMEYEFRSTLVPELHHENEIRAMVETIQGAQCYVLQNFSRRECLDSRFRKMNNFSPEQMARFQAIAKNGVKSCLVR